MRTLVLALALPAQALIAALPLPAQSPPPPAPSPAGGPLSLSEAIALARQNNPTFLSQANARRTADAAVRSARAALLPSADASLATRYQQAGQQVFSGQSFLNGSPTLQSTYSLGLNYRVNSATFVAPRAAAATREAVEADITGAAEQLRAAVTQQYLSVLQAQARSALQDTLVRTAEYQLQLARAKMQVGAGTSLDVRRAEVALGQAQVAQLRERNTVDVERLRLFQQLGVPQPAGVRLVTEFPVATPAVSLDQLLDDARRRNPALAALRARERSAGLNVAVARSQYTPTLNVATGLGGNSYQYTNSEFLVEQARQNALETRASCFQFDSVRTRVGLRSYNCGLAIPFGPAQEQAIRDQNRQWPLRFLRAPLALTASLSLPLFDNFAREERVQAAQVARENADYGVRARELALTAEVTQAYLTVTTNAQAVRLQEQNAAKAREELQYAEERYKVGASTFLDVVTSRASYEQALIDRVTAVYDYHKAFAALENAVGHPLR